ncbi:MAG: DNA ligase [Firmicutes bacterium]|nr:DNA ligase [Bacillota bacterium]
MSKMAEIATIIDELRDTASSINRIADELTDLFSYSSKTPEIAPAPEKTMSLEEVRAILAEKSRDGFTAQIRDLLQKYGASKLSEIDPGNYMALVADAEVLGNA